MQKKLTITILLIIALVGVGVVAYQTLAPAQEKSDTGPRILTQSPSPSAPSEIDTSDWETYIDDALGVSFQYPPKWGSPKEPKVIGDKLYTFSFRNLRYHGLSNIGAVNPSIFISAANPRGAPTFYLGEDDPMQFCRQSSYFQGKTFLVWSSCDKTMVGNATGASRSFVATDANGVVTLGHTILFQHPDHPIYKGITVELHLTGIGDESLQQKLASQSEQQLNAKLRSILSDIMEGQRYPILRKIIMDLEASLKTLNFDSM